MTEEQKVAEPEEGPAPQEELSIEEKLDILLANLQLLSEGLLMLARRLDALEQWLSEEPEPSGEGH
jgi:hypothetical protein